MAVVFLTVTQYIFQDVQFKIFKSYWLRMCILISDIIFILLSYFNRVRSTLACISNNNSSSLHCICFSSLPFPNFLDTLQRVTIYTVPGTKGERKEKKADSLKVFFHLRPRRRHIFEPEYRTAAINLTPRGQVARVGSQEVRTRVAKNISEIRTVCKKCRIGRLITQV